MKSKTKHGYFVETKALAANKLPSTDLGKISGKNPSVEGLIRLIQEFFKSVAKTSRKVREPKTYNEIINNFVNGNR